MKIFKFGGASVKSAEAVKNVTRILGKYNENLVVVVSAMGKTTNLLETLVRAYFNKDEKKYEIFQEFKAYHKEIMDDLFDGNGIPESLTFLFVELEAKLKKVPSLDYNFEYDQIICFGELVSTQIISDYLNYAGVKNQWIDIRACLRTDDNFRDASVDWEWTEELVQDTFRFNGQNLYITQGFIGSTTTNLTTSLGREGSDFTAAILGNILNAESVSFWKDVPGVLSADPKKMDGAVKITELSYREAVEMTHSGAQIIHPKTMKPLHNKGISLYVKSFLEPENSGTVIHKIDHKIELPPIFILKENLVLITLSPKDFSFISINDIDRVVNFLLENRVKVTLMQQSAIDLNLVIDAPEADLQEIFLELKPFYSVRYNTDLTLITIRHYTEEVLDWMVKEKDIYLEQHSRLTARMLVKQ
ncbi:aspartate kinase [Maribellus comscasis]|uniref:Aspartokinase n=1 Tax=Maribellus comscasis TaxID=2681766 RepID=A0A6I6K0F6_9BACT|nr:aspartate kinase [Maribellus comscasis]QGY44883.1 aspartate kinase [Maribellus comscasis]